MLIFLSVYNTHLLWSSFAPTVDLLYALLVADIVVTSRRNQSFGGGGWSSSVTYTLTLTLVPSTQTGTIESTNDTMDPLEYDEESEGDDLFGSDDETALPPTFAVDERVPIGRTKVSQNKKARLPSPPVPTSPPPIKSLKDTQLTPDQRMNQLRNSRAMIPPPPPLGVPSLKVLTLAGKRPAVPL